MRVYLLKKIENIVAKGEIGNFEQFLLLTQCFQKSSAAEASETIYMWERVITIIILHVFHAIYVGIIIICYRR